MNFINLINKQASDNKKAAAAATESTVRQTSNRFQPYGRQGEATSVTPRASNQSNGTAVVTINDQPLIVSQQQVVATQRVQPIQQIIVVPTQPPPPPIIANPNPQVIPKELVISHMNQQVGESVGNILLVTNSVENLTDQNFASGIKLFTGSIVGFQVEEEYKNLIEKRVTLYLGCPVSKITSNHMPGTSMTTTHFLPLHVTPFFIINKLSGLVEVYKRMATSFGFDSNDVRIAFMSDIAVSKKRIDFIVGRGHNGAKGVIPFQRSTKELTFEQLENGVRRPFVDPVIERPDYTTLVNVGQQPITIYVLTSDTLLLNGKKSSNKSHTTTKLKDLNVDVLGKISSVSINSGSFIMFPTGMWFSYDAAPTITVEASEWQSHLCVIETFFGSRKVSRLKHYSSSHRRMISEQIRLIPNETHYGNGTMEVDVMTSLKTVSCSWDTDKMTLLNDEWKSVLQD